MKVLIKSITHPADKRAHNHGRIDPNRFTPYPKNPTICRFMVQIGRYEELQKYRLTDRGRVLLKEQGDTAAAHRRPSAVHGQTK